MLGLTLVSAVAAIIVGLIASLIAATVGKTCVLDNTSEHWNFQITKWRNSHLLH